MSSVPAPASGGTAADVDLQALRRLLRPRRVAIVGASRTENSVGGLLLRNVLQGGFTGEVYPVNPHAAKLQGVTAYASITDCPDVPDLAVIAVPARIVLEVVDEAGRQGVSAICVISAGFAEAGVEGERRGDELLKTVRRHGMRMIGPNCMGLLNASPEMRLNATFSHSFPEAGRVGMLSQSGALGLAVLDHADELQLGLSTFVSVGNKLDVTADDLLQYWEHDDDTHVLLLYLESFNKPRLFHRHARRIARKKPIVVVKSGRTAAGERAASSHTAAVSGGDVAVDALFAQSGVLRADTLREMFETTQLLVNQPPPRGHRVGIITNGGGPGILAADACQSHGLEVPTLSHVVRDRLRELLPEAAATSNPVDLLAGADAATYERAVRIIAESDEVDALVVIFIPPIVTEAEEVANALAASRQSLPEGVPMLSVFMGHDRCPQALVDARIPAYPFPEEAARALGRVARWTDWRDKPEGKIVEPGDINRNRCREIVAEALSDNRQEDDGTVWMTGVQAYELLTAYGLTLAQTHVVSSADEAAQAQKAIGRAVAVKVDAPIHKADVGGVVLNCQTPEKTAAAVDRIESSLEQAGKPELAGSYLIQEMVDDGVQLAAGVREDPSFGPLLMVGLGGQLLELMGDVSVRIAPTTDREAREMIESLKSYPLLNGYRNQPKLDQDALLDLIHRLSALADEVSSLVELDLNPIFVKQDGVIATDMRMRLRSH